MISPAIPRVALVRGGPWPAAPVLARALVDAGFAVALETGPGPAGDDTPALRLPQGLPGGQAVAETIRELGPPGLLVNACAVSEGRSDESAPAPGWGARPAPALAEAVAATEAVVAALPPAAEGVVLNLLPAEGPARGLGALPAILAHAGLWAFTQTAALALAPRLRVNALGVTPPPVPRCLPEQFAAPAAAPLGTPPATPEDFARTVLAILSLPSMTGQLILLSGAVR